MYYCRGSAFKRALSDVRSAVHPVFADLPALQSTCRLEDAKTDEDGRAMHEDCYYAGLKGTMPITGSQSN